MMKKLSTLFLSLFLVLTVVSPTQAAPKPVGVWIDGAQVQLGNVNPINEKGTTLVPMRPFFQKLGVNVVWDGKTKTVTGTKDGLKLQLTVGSTNATVNGQTKKLPVAPKSINNVTYVPVRFIGETTGYSVAWNPSLRTITFEAQKPVNGSKGFLWKVENKGNTVYLLGSIHVADKAMYPLRPEIEAAFNESQYLGVELDMTKVDSASMEKFMAEKGTYTDGTTLKDHISPATYNKLVKFLTDNKLPANSFDQYKPWLVSNSLTGMQAQDSGYQTDIGIDMYFLQKSKQLNKPVIELETAELQLNMLAGFSDQLQEKQLNEMLEALTQPAAAAQDNSADQLNQMWKQGDEDTLVAFTKASATEPEYYKAMLQDRNDGMVKHVKEYLNSDKGSTYFIVVGALHMLGDHGIVTQLKQEGYNVVKQ